MRKELLT